MPNRFGGWKQVSFISNEDWVGSSQNAKGFVFPNGLNICCPHCNRAAHFSTRGKLESNSVPVVIAYTQCPSCKSPLFLIAPYEQKDATVRQDPLSLILYCNNSNNYEPPNFGDEVPIRLRRSFASTVNSYNSGNYSAAMNGARRTLEGIFKLRDTANKGKKLHELIANAEVDPDFSVSLAQLASAIKEGGNLGSHFDDEKEPDRELAFEAVELLEYLIRYFYELPSRISGLERLLKKS